MTSASDEMLKKDEERFLLAKTAQRGSGLGSLEMAVVVLGDKG